MRLRATRWPGTGTPVLLLHGLASQRRFWNLVVPHLVAGRNAAGPGAGLPVLAIDQRGHGDSDRPESGYELTTVAADLSSALDALGWSRVVLVGHSWGGAVAATFAAAHPERVLALVGVDGGFVSPPAGIDRAAARRRLEPPRIEMPPDELVAMLSSRSPGSWGPELAAAVLPIFAVGADGRARPRLPFDTHMQIVDTLLDYDASATLAQVQAPTWLVSCEPLADTDDFTAHKTSALQQLASVLPRVRVLRWLGAVHDVPLQWPALVAGLVRAAAEDAAVAGRPAS